MPTWRLASGKSSVRYLLVVERCRQPGVDVRDVEPFEIVVAVERPVRAHEVVARSRGVEAHLVDRQEAHAPIDLAHDPGKRDLGIERREDELPPGGERDGRQVVGFLREPFHIVELRHREQPSVEAEAATVVATAKDALDAASFADQHAAVRAHVRERVEAVDVIAGEQDRFVQASFQQRYRRDLPGDAHLVEVPGKLPAPGEHTCPASLVGVEVPIERGGKGRRAVDVGIDGRRGLAHRRFLGCRAAGTGTCAQPRLRVLSSCGKNLAALRQREPGETRSALPRTTFRRDGGGRL